MKPGQVWSRVVMLIMLQNSFKSWCCLEHPFNILSLHPRLWGHCPLLGNAWSSARAGVAQPCAPGGDAAVCCRTMCLQARDRWDLQGDVGASEAGAVEHGVAVPQPCALPLFLFSLWRCVGEQPFSKKAVAEMWMCTCLCTSTCFCAHTHAHGKVPVASMARFPVCILIFNKRYFEGKFSFFLNEELNLNSRSPEMKRFIQKSSSIWREGVCCCDCLWVLCWWGLFSEPPLLELALLHASASAWLLQIVTLTCPCCSSDLCSPPVSLCSLLHHWNLGLLPTCVFSSSSLVLGDLLCLLLLFQKLLYHLLDGWLMVDLSLFAILAVPNAYGEDLPQPGQCLDQTQSLGEQEG